MIFGYFFIGGKLYNLTLKIMFVIALLLQPWNCELGYHVDIKLNDSLNDINCYKKRLLSYKLLYSYYSKTLEPGTLNSTNIPNLEEFKGEPKLHFFGFKSSYFQYEHWYQFEINCNKEIVAITPRLTQSDLIERDNNLYLILHQEEK